MLGFITLLLVCQLAGEVIARLAGLPLPGPVIGMALLFAGLLIKGEMPARLQATVQGLLDHLSLLFVPAGVGVMLHLSLIRDELLPVVAAILGSTVVTIAATALVMRAMARLIDRKTDGDEKKERK